MKEQITSLIAKAIEELNEQLDDNEKISLESNIQFIGENACIDSLGFITFVAILEDLIATTFDKNIQLVSEKAFSQKNSPFHSVETLASYIKELIEEN